MVRYLVNILIAADQMVNAILGGDPEQTITFRAATARGAGARWGCVLCGALHLIHRDHCDKSLTANDPRGRRRSHD